ncbi:MAG: sel1 repeat family protein [Verrucomicrobia bacterium]|nr:sel1 repeat family protein [Verrucomicrobiota bacterium]
MSPEQKSAGSVGAPCPSNDPTFNSMSASHRPHFPNPVFPAACAVLLIAGVACRKDAPAPSPGAAGAPAQARSTPARTNPAPPSTNTPGTSVKPHEQPATAPSVTPVVPAAPPAPAIVKVPVDGPDIFLRDQRPPVDYAQQFREHRDAAKQGSARAQAKLGQMYWNAHGTERNPVAAIEWLRKAAEQGDPEGQFYLGYAYEQGFGVARDDAEAVRWKRKALEQGFQPTLPSSGSEGVKGRP